MLHLGRPASVSQMFGVQEDPINQSINHQTHNQTSCILESMNTKTECTEFIKINWLNQSNIILVRTKLFVNWNESLPVSNDWSSGKPNQSISNDYTWQIKAGHFIECNIHCFESRELRKIKSNQLSISILNIVKVSA